MCLRIKRKKTILWFIILNNNFNESYIKEVKNNDLNILQRNKNRKSSIDNINEDINKRNINDTDSDLSKDEKFNISENDSHIEKKKFF